MQFSMAVCEPDAFVAVQVSERPASPPPAPTQTRFAPSFLPQMRLFGLGGFSHAILSAARAAEPRPAPAPDSSDIC